MNLEFINLHTILTFLTLFIINMTSSQIGTLKNILIAKQIGKWAFIITAIDAIIYFIVLKSVTSSNGIIALIAYVLGHTIGAMVGDIIEKKMAIGLYELKVYVDNENKLKIINDFCYQNSYSITITEGLSPGGKKRYILFIECTRKDKNNLINGIKKLGIEKLTMTISELKDISGRILERTE